MRTTVDMVGETVLYPSLVTGQVRAGVVRAANDDQIGVQWADQPCSAECCLHLISTGHIVDQGKDEPLIVSPFPLGVA
jgi:hypothetical protein